jgi:peroxisomal 2,4-dienoyl-CoA reductase
MLTYASGLAPNGTGGRIIFVSSTNYRSARLSQAHVCAAKAGVNALSDCISLEYGPRGITSNIIAPGPIDNTEGMSRLLQPEAREEAMRNVPLQRFGLIKDVADATVFLFADTGNFVNGACLDVDGGSWRIKSGSASSASSTRYPDMYKGPESKL